MHSKEEVSPMEMSPMEISPKGVANGSITNGSVGSGSVAHGGPLSSLHVCQPTDSVDMLTDVMNVQMTLYNLFTWSKVSVNFKAYCYKYLNILRTTGNCFLKLV